MLREIAVRLTRVMRPQDTVARRGGDEFAVLVPDVGSMMEVEKIAERLLGAVAQPADASRRLADLTVSASIGVALAPEQGRDLERLLQLADLAMYDAKLKGKNRYAFAHGASMPAKVTPLVPRVSRVPEHSRSTRPAALPRASWRQAMPSARCCARPDPCP